MTIRFPLAGTRASGIVILVLLLCCMSSLHTSAQPRVKSRHKRVDSLQFVPAPLISYNRSVGFIAGAIPMAMYPISRADTVSPPSLSAVMGFYSTSGTWAIATFHRLYVDEDRWRFLLGGGFASVEFQTYVSNPVDDMVDYTTGAAFLAGEVQRQILPHWYAGLRVISSFAQTVFDSELQDTIIDEFLTLGAVTSVDTRDEQYFPRSGIQSEVRVDGNPEWLGNDIAFTKLQAHANAYFPMRNDEDVLAVRGKVGTGLGADLPFTQQFIVGTSRDIRGYTQGEYRGNSILAAQAEYRFHVGGPFFLMGFAGVATVYGSSAPEQNGLLLPGGGLGVRYSVFTDNIMNIGLDAAVGRDDWGVYFRIGEAF